MRSQSLVIFSGLSKGFSGHQISDFWSRADDGAGFTRNFCRRFSRGRIGGRWGFEGSFSAVVSSQWGRGGEGETEEDSINGDLIGIRLNGSSWDGLTRLLLVTCLVGWEDVDSFISFSLSVLHSSCLTFLLRLLGVLASAWLCSFVNSDRLGWPLTEGNTPRLLLPGLYFPRFNARPDLPDLPDLPDRGIATDVALVDLFISLRFNRILLRLLRRLWGDSLLFVLFDFVLVCDSRLLFWDS